jgi:hypothetical protein
MTATRGWLFHGFIGLFFLFFVLVLALLSGVILLAQQPEAGTAVSVSGEVASSLPPGQIPRLIRFSGMLRDAAGNPETGSVAVTFALYETQENGSPLWVETQMVQLNAAGQYTALLGATQPEGLPLDLFASSRAQWLGVQPQVPGEGEQPRILLVGVPYALKAADADTLGGIPASAFLLAPVTPVGSSAAVVTNASEAVSQKSPRSAVSLVVTPCTTVASNGTANANSIALFTSTACTIGGSAITQNGTTVQFTGGITGTTATFSGAMQAAGDLVPPLVNATTAAGSDSNPLDLQTSVYNTAVAGPVSYDFRWQAEPHGNDSTDTFGSLNLLYGVPGDISETGLSVAHTGIITFAAGQTFGNVGTITGVTAGTDLTGGGTSGTVTLNLNTAATDGRYSRLAAANAFTGNQSVTGNVAATGTVSGSQLVSSVATGTAPLIVASTTTVANLNASFLGGKAASAFPSLAAANTFTGNQSVTGNVTATGTVTATGNVSGKQLVSSVATGTAPLVVTSTTEVANLNASFLGGKAASAFPSLAAANAFTGNQSVTGNVTATGTVTATGNVSGKQLVSSVATGTAPLVVTSTTAVANLNASLVGGKAATSFANLSGGNTLVGVQNITAATVGATALSVTSTDTTSALTTGLVVTDDTMQSTAIVFKASAPNIGTSGSSCTVFASGNLVCTGTKSAAVPLNNGRMAALYAVEAPENWFEDFGSGKLVGGIATVALEPAYAQTVNVNVSYHVFVTPKGDCEGLYVAKETPAGFEVHELRGGKSDVDFDYRIVARRRGYEAVRLADVTGQVSRPSLQAVSPQAEPLK